MKVLGGMLLAEMNNDNLLWSYRVQLFAKLLIVMGVASLSVPLDYFLGSDDPLSPFAVMLRCVHFIPVVSILFIFGFNEKNVRLINQKYPRVGSKIANERTVY
jgi:hypothetical protein